jgi:predicted signal transduction protein with EAL and GGDEF domain
MKSSKLELIALIIITLVVLGAAFITFFMPRGSGELISNILLTLGAITYVGFSVISFQRFDAKIRSLKEELEGIKISLAEKTKALEDENKLRIGTEIERDRLAKELDESESERKRLEAELSNSDD